MLSNRKKFFTIHKKTSWVVKILAGYLAGIILIFAAGASLIRPVSVIAAFSPNLDSSSETVSEEEESSALPSSELSPEAESSDEKAAAETTRVRIRSIPINRIQVPLPNPLPPLQILPPNLPLLPALSLSRFHLRNPPMQTLWCGRRFTA